jgi:hypothetical protein
VKIVELSLKPGNSLSEKKKKVENEQKKGLARGKKKRIVFKGSYEVG